MLRGALTVGLRNRIARGVLRRCQSGSFGGGVGARQMEKLRKLEQAANSAPQDARRQLTFYRELNRSHPQLVAQRISGGRFASNDGVMTELVKAQAAMGQYGVGGSGMDGMAAAAAAQQQQQQQQQQQYAGGYGGGGAFAAGTHSAAPAAGGAAAAAASYGQGATPAAPLYVSAVEASFKTQMWRTVRYCAGLFLLVSALGVVLEDRGMGGKAGGLGGGAGGPQPVTSDKTFADIRGVDEPLADLREIVAYLQDSERFTRLGGKLPKGLLLMGPPGTGKTLLARAVAGEAGVPFFYASGSDFEEMYVGVGARRVRDLFEAAKKAAPCIIFIDEIDAIGSSRQLKEQQAMKMTLNQLLVEMDGFQQNNGVIVIGATNFPEVLDDALQRPGRFDRKVAVPLPDIRGRQEILSLYCEGLSVSDDVDVGVLARATPGMAGADLANLCNQAALKASVDGSAAVDMAAFEFAKDKIIMGAERRSAVISPETARMTAYHEGGHALVAIMTAGAHPVYKATIMPRGQALGYVAQLPEGDQTSMSRKQYLARLDVCMGGRVAEELIFGPDEVTSGASSDLKQASELARAMVRLWGYSDRIGPVYHDGKSGQLSAEVSNAIDDEVKAILDSSYARARALLEKNRPKLEIIAKSLIEHETLSGEEIKRLLEGKPLLKKT
jgi:ATP-dependent metalloprotease